MTNYLEKLLAGADVKCSYNPSLTASLEKTPKSPEEGTSELIKSPLSGGWGLKQTEDWGLKL